MRRTFHVGKSEVGKQKETPFDLDSAFRAAESGMGPVMRGFNHESLRGQRVRDGSGRPIQHSDFCGCGGKREPTQTGFHVVTEDIDLDIEGNDKRRLRRVDGDNLVSAHEEDHPLSRVDGDNHDQT